MRKAISTGQHVRENVPVPAPRTVGCSFLTAFFLVGGSSAVAAPKGNPIFWPEQVCRQAKLVPPVDEWSSEDGIRRFRLERDFDEDGRPDVLELSESEGSGGGLSEANLTLTSDGSKIEVALEFGYGSWIQMIDVPPALLGPKRRTALEMFEDVFFGGTCDRIDPSLAWLLARPKNLRWIAGPPRLPRTYVVRISAERLSALRKGKLGLETAVQPKKDGDVWILYSGGVHRNDALLPDARLPRKPLARLASSGDRVLLGTSHGVLLTDTDRARYAWIYIRERGIEKFRWPSIVAARFSGQTAVIDLDSGVLEDEEARQLHQRGHVRVDLETGSVREPK